VFAHSERTIAQGRNRRRAFVELSAVTFTSDDNDASPFDVCDDAHLEFFHADEDDEQRVRAPQAGARAARSVTRARARLRVNVCAFGVPLRCLTPDDARRTAAVGA
jgi:hypothetical protein